MAIVAAIDRSDRAEDVVREAGTLAEAFDDTVHLVHVLTRTEFVELERTNVNNTGEPLDLDEVKAVAKEIAAEAAEGLTVPYECFGLIGDPASTIVDYVEEEGARYLVIGARKRSPTGKALFGSAAQSMLLNAPCPVVTTLR
ncbi:universal stress protein [Halobellus captivus]|uniref:universal stress protein n=1 Tax=Halobellus captivus TaxID=2592614 RepID=UPI0011A96D6A|nr:universal stress protein [Halobellus captivus]